MSVRLVAIAIWSLLAGASCTVSRTDLVIDGAAQEEGAHASRTPVPPGSGDPRSMPPDPSSGNSATPVDSGTVVPDAVASTPQEISQPPSDAAVATATPADAAAIPVKTAPVDAAPIPLETAAPVDVAAMPGPEPASPVILRVRDIKATSIRAGVLYAHLLDTKNGSVARSTAPLSDAELKTQLGAKDLNVAEVTADVIYAHDIHVESAVVPETHVTQVKIAGVPQP
jgi:hypothetical protein